MACCLHSSFNHSCLYRSIWNYVYRHYSDQFDYFLLGGDDMFVLVENLLEYLGSEEIRAERDKGRGG